jgi:apolipoprotein D and lipocalin family protein
MRIQLRGVVCVAVLALACGSDKPLDVARVDLAKFEGGYFEIAKLPRPTQAECAGTTAYYRRVSEAELSVVHECREGSLDGPLRRSAARAVVPDPDVPAKLSLDVGGFFGDYWIVDVADDYRYVAVGHPSRDYLWILSRSSTLPADDLDALQLRLSDADFDVSRLEFTEQRSGDQPVGEPRGVPELESHGCAVARGRSLRPSGSAAIVVLAGVLSLLRVRVSRARRRRARGGAA